MENNRKYRIIVTVAIIVAIACIGVLAGALVGNRKRRSSSPKSEMSAASSASASLSAASSTGESVNVSADLPDESAEESTSDTAQEAANRAAAPELMQVGGIAVGNVAEYYGAVNGLLSGGDAGSAAAATEENGSGHVVCIDAGHQDHGMSDTEPNGPGSSTMKAKLTTGTYGPASGKNEYEINLEVALKLRDSLVGRGYTVVMTRESNDVNISNVERAEIANNADADIFIRIHCNGSDNTSAHGVLCYEPTYSNPYLTESVITGSQRLARTLVDAQCAATGQKNLGTISGDDMTGINWAKMPVTIVEMGFMSNTDEDLFLASEDGQAEIVQGLTNGIDAYFAG